MKKKRYEIIILKIVQTSLLLVLLTSFKPVELPNQFIDLLERAKMTFDKPTGFSDAKLIENSEMNYEYAIQNATKKFEIRYSIRPLDHAIAEYEEREKAKKQGDSNINPNDLYASIFQMLILNISGGELPEIREFDKQTVKAQFKADWGASTFVRISTEFGQKYKYCMIVAIHKNELGDAYLFFLSESKTNFEKQIARGIHSLKFK